MLMMLHNHRSGQFHIITSKRESPSNGFRDTHFGPWASPCWSNEQPLASLYDSKWRKIMMLHDKRQDNSIEYRTVKIHRAISEARIAAHGRAHKDRMGNPIWVNGQITMMLHNFKLRRFHGTSNREDQSKNFRDMHSGPWEGIYGSNGQVIMMWHEYNLSLFHRTSEEIHPAVLIMYSGPWASPYE